MISQIYDLKLFCERKNRDKRRAEEKLAKECDGGEELIFEKNRRAQLPPTRLT